MMTSISRALLLSAALTAAPLVGAIAQQQGNPGGNYGSNRSSTATPGTADNSSASGMHTGDIGARNTTGNSVGMGAGAPGSPSAHSNGATQTYNSQTTSLPGPNHSNTGGGNVGGGAGSSK